MGFIPNGGNQLFVKEIIIGQYRQICLTIVIGGDVQIPIAGIQWGQESRQAENVVIPCIGGSVMSYEKAQLRTRNKPDFSNLKKSKKVKYITPIFNSSKSQKCKNSQISNLEQVKKKADKFSIFEVKAHIIFLNLHKVKK